MAPTTQQPTRRLAGKVAVVTGAGRGIGRAEALLLAQQGARVVVNDVSERAGETARDVVDRIRASGSEAEASTDNVGIMEGAERIVRTAVERFGRLDILVNNAGIVAPGEVAEMSEADWDRVLTVNLKGTFAMTRHASRVFEQQRGGVIINTSSESGLGHPAMANYSAAKEGIIGFTRAVARELGRFGVRCNAIRPRAFDTGGTGVYFRAYQRWQPLYEALGRYAVGSRGLVRGAATADTVAALVVWLCSDTASNVNGRTFAVGGDEIGLWSEPEVTRTLYREGGWTLDGLDSAARERLIGDLTNDFLLPDFGTKDR